MWSLEAKKCSIFLPDTTMIFLVREGTEYLLCFLAPFRCLFATLSPSPATQTTDNNNPAHKDGGHLSTYRFLRSLRENAQHFGKIWAAGWLVCAQEEG